jgi:hypothetical protein
MTKRPHDIATRSRAALDRRKAEGAFKRETFSLARPEARAKARELLDRYPPAAYGTVIESWSLLPDGRIQFTVRRLPTAD